MISRAFAFAPLASPATISFLATVLSQRTPEYCFPAGNLQQLRNAPSSPLKFLPKQRSASMHGRRSLLHWLISSVKAEASIPTKREASYMSLRSSFARAARKQMCARVFRPRHSQLENQMIVRGLHMVPNPASRKVWITSLTAPDRRPATLNSSAPCACRSSSGRPATLQGPLDTATVHAAVTVGVFRVAQRTKYSWPTVLRPGIGLLRRRIAPQLK